MRSASQLGQWLEENPQIAGCVFCGCSNVGKSSLINALFGRKTARTSKTPGRTKSVNIFDFQIEGSPDPFHLFDPPGYGYAKVSKKEAAHWRRLMETFFTALPEAVALIHLRDIRHSDRPGDREFCDYAKNFGENRRVFCVFNKSDKLTRKERDEFEKKRPDILKDYPPGAESFVVSAKSGEGTEALSDSLVREFLLFV